MNEHKIHDHIYFWEPYSSTVLVKTADEIYNSHECSDDDPDAWVNSPYVNLLCVDGSESKELFRFGFWNSSGNWLKQSPGDFPIEFKTRLMLLGVSV